MVLPGNRAEGGQVYLLSVSRNSYETFVLSNEGSFFAGSFAASHLLLCELEFRVQRRSVELGKLSVSERRFVPRRSRLFE